MRSAHLASLESLLRSKKGASEPEFKSTLAGLRSEITERLKIGRPSSIEFFSSSVRALARLRGLGHAEVRISCLADISFFCVTQGYSAEPAALAAINELALLAEGVHDQPWIRKAALLRGLINADLGNIAEALICYCRSWEMARELGDQAGQGAVLVNLGMALNYGALYREAIPCLQLAIELERLPEVRDTAFRYGDLPIQAECAALNNLAQSYLYLEEYEKGFAAISACLAQSADPVDSKTAISRVVREFTFVQLALELGRIEEAWQHTTICERYARPQSLRAKQLARTCRGLCEVYAGDADTGLEQIQSALRIADTHGTIRAPTLVALIRACEQAGRPDVALEHMNQLMAQIRSTRETSFGVLLSSYRGSDFVSPSSDDLRALELTAARLRAKVAETRALDARIEMLERLSITADLREEQSGEHGYRVGKLSSLIAEGLCWPKDARYAIELAARLHDIGKIGVPDRILFKTQELRDAERDMMSVHAVIGAELLAKSDVPQLRMAEDIARYHHEWWNGAGYPAKLAGKRIPIHARIVALADVFDALTHGRPYAPVWTIERALEEIQARRGTQFDPELTDRFVDLVRRLQKEHADLDEYLGRAGRNSPFAQARNRIRLMLEEGRERIDKQVNPESATVH
jgi:putative two-component system response regulator